MDRATYEQLDRIEDQQNDIVEALELIQQKLGISTLEHNSEDYDDDDMEETPRISKNRKGLPDLDF